ncbi:hypothetical protein PoB_003283900 [Plakobranchus ocellatus]|uniref:Uncharacterized protein n=1 Tax=Plakobranchus ocellatus TaxID=259542 RepID=A0AAV4AF90_9GAST|nr:hypothetical protein PoB_003283900 [Plakobranchus ocellatus]
MFTASLVPLKQFYAEVAELLSVVEENQPCNPQCISRNIDFLSGSPRESARKLEAPAASPQQPKVGTRKQKKDATNDRILSLEKFIDQFSRRSSESFDNFKRMFEKMS